MRILHLSYIEYIDILVINWLVYALLSINYDTTYCYGIFLRIVMEEIVRDDSFAFID